MSNLDSLLNGFPRAGFVPHPTPMDRLNNLSERLDLDLWIKRDDLTGIGLGGNKIRQLDYYFGAAQNASADTILITGAVQSNYVRSAAACAARTGMKSILQLENRVPNKDEIYATSGNVLLSKLLGAEHMFYPEGEDESGADDALRARAVELQAEGRCPYVIPLGLHNKPLGALGYMRAAEEVVTQDDTFDAVVVASGSGMTHSGILAGLRAMGSDVAVHGICVRRDAKAQFERLQVLGRNISDLLRQKNIFSDDDIHTWDEALAPGYGQMGDHTRHALHLMAQSEGLFLDPVYTSKSFAGLLALRASGVIASGNKVLFVHTGGQPALFAYGDDLLGP